MVDKFKDLISEWVGFRSYWSYFNSRAAFWKKPWHFYGWMYLCKPNISSTSKNSSVKAVSSYTEIPSLNPQASGTFCYSSIVTIATSVIQHNLNMLLH